MASKLSSSLQRFRLDGICDTGITVGDGTYAIVLQYNFRGLKCVGKKIRRLIYEPWHASSADRTKVLRRFEEECELLGRLHHPNIVQFLGVHVETGSALPVLVMEYLPTNLSGYLDSHGILPDETSYGILRDVALGLRYLHEYSPPIVHRDLSANNVLLTASLSAKISDLGVAKFLNVTPSEKTKRIPIKSPGSPCYMPPEALIARPRYTRAIDSYSFGVLVLHVLCGEWPFPTDPFKPDAHNPDVVVPVTEVDRRLQFIQQMGSDHPLTGLVHQCLSNVQKSRPEIADILHQINTALSQLPAPTKVMFQQLEGLRSDNQRLGIENQSFKSELQTLESDVQRLGDETQSLASDNQRLETENLSLKNEVQELGSETQSLTNDKQMLETENHSLQNEVQALESDVQRLGSEMQSLASDNQRLETVKKSLQNEVQTFESDVQRLESEVQSLTSSTQSLETEKERLQSEVQTLGSEVQRLGSETQSLTSDNRRLETENRSLQIKAQTLEGDVQSLTSENERLKNENQTLRERSHMRPPSSRAAVYQPHDCWNSLGTQDTILIISNEKTTARNTDVVPRCSSEITEEDRKEMISQGLSPDECTDDISIVQARIRLDTKLEKVNIVSSDRGSKLTRKSVLQQLEKHLKTTTKPSVTIFYIGPGKKDTGDWCFKDGFITFRDIAELYSRVFHTRALTIITDCSHSGAWVDACVKYLDEQGVRPCGHSLKEKGIVLEVFASCRPEEVAATNCFFVRSAKNNKNDGTLTYYYSKQLRESQQAYGLSTTEVRCGTRSIEEECTLSPEYCWRRMTDSKRVFIHRGKVRGKQSWQLVLLEDNPEKIKRFKQLTRGEQAGKNTLFLAEYGRILKRGWGKDPPKEVIEEMYSEYPV